jgi:NAD+ synthase (glutamine-hydrolysing)
MMTLPAAHRGAPDATISHDFSLKGSELPSGGPDKFEAIDDQFKRRAEETMRNTALWIRDYLKKTELQGFIISLSGGADSAFGAVMVSQAIDINIKQLEETTGDKGKAVASFINQFSHLEYRQAVLDEIQKNGADAAVDLLKKKMLTCIYLPSDNSGHVTLNAARTLIEGGDVNGNHVKGIGGKFEVVNVQASVDSFIEAFAGIVHKDIVGKTIEVPAGSGNQISLLEQVRKEFKEYVAGTRFEFSEGVEAVINQKDPARRLSWRNAEDDITLQNIQARARQPYPWMFANKEHKIACVTSNWSEAVAGYWTFGGDGHMGAINLCGGIPKSHLKKMLRYLENDGLEGIAPVPALNPVNVQIPTAELRPTEQSDEADMMPYKMLDAIGEAIFFNKHTPLEAYRHLQKAKDPDDHSKLLFAKHGNPQEPDKEYLIQCIEKACKMWHRSQFKRVGSVITPFLGQNVDPHTSVRTTILSDGFQTSVAQMKLAYLDETLGNNFKQGTGFDLAELSLRSKINRQARDVVVETPLATLPEALTKLSTQLVVSEPIAVGGVR